MASFTTATLVNNRVLVMGTDNENVKGSTVLDSTQWEEVCTHSEFDRATVAFDNAVEEFFAPLTEATDALESITAGKPVDPASFVVLHEKVEATPGNAGVLIQLTRDSIILRLLEVNDFDRLVWVNDELEILALEDTPVNVVPVSVNQGGDLF